MKRSELPAIGSPFEGGFFTDVLRIDGKPHAVITSDKSCEFKGAYGDFEDPERRAFHFADSRKNTEVMAELGSKTAKKALAMTAGGFNDWALPARDAAERQYRRFKPGTGENFCSWRDGENPNAETDAGIYTDESPAQTTVEAFKAGGPQAFEKKYYLTSTRSSRYDAIVQGFGDGGQDGYDLHGEYLVRPVRMVPLDD